MSRYTKIGLADVQCSRLKFEPGDRVIVRVYHRIDKDQRKKIEKAIQKWAGVTVEVLVVDTTQFDVEVIKRAAIPSTLRADES